MKQLTERQRQLLAFIEDHLRDHGYPPSIREMAEHMGIRSTNGVNDHLKALERKGHISRDAGPKSRAIALTRGAAGRRSQSSGEGLVEIPILGRVAAGAPILAEENVEGHLPVGRSLIGSGPDVFALRIEGDSMVEKGIFDGDFVFVRQQRTAQAGQMVVAMIEGEATVKTYRPGRDKVVFEPANPAYRPIVIHKQEARQVELLGVVTGVFRRV